MTSRRPNKRAAFFAAAVLLAAALMLSCGCAWIGSALGGGRDTDQASTAPATEAAVTEQPKSTQYLPPNPVFTLFNEWFSALRNAESGMLDAAAELTAGDYELASAHSELRSCESALSLIYATAGMMTSEGSGWAGSFTGSFEGSGTMSSRGVFEYDFADGRVLAGRMEDGFLICRLGEDVEPFDPTEPTPLPTEAPGESSAELTEQADEPTDAPTEEPTAQTTEAVIETEAPSPVVPPDEIDWRDAGAYSGGAEVMALLRTEGGFIAIAARGGRLSIIEVKDGRLYFAGDASAAVRAGLDPLLGIAEGGLAGCRVLVYERGTLGFEPMAG